MKDIIVRQSALGVLLVLSVGGLGCSSGKATPAGGGGGSTAGTGGSGGRTGGGGANASGGSVASGGGANGVGGVSIAGGSNGAGGAKGSGGVAGGGGSLDGGTTPSDAAGTEAGVSGCSTAGWLPAGANWAVRTADSILANHPDPESVSGNHFSWQLGYTMWSIEKVWRSTKDPKYFAWLKKFADMHVDATGKLTGFGGAWIDDHLPGYTLMAVYEETKDERYSKAAKVIREHLLTYPRNTDRGFWHGEGLRNQMWVDGVYMGQMFLVRYAHDTPGPDQASWFDEVVKQMTIIVSHCQKPNGLLLHGYDESKSAGWADKTTGLSREVWSEGLGWYAILIADVFDWLPADHPGRATLMDILRKLAVGLKDNQDQKTGRWCQVVDKCTQAGNWNESSGTGMFLYFLKASIDKGYLDAATYCPVVEKAYKGLVEKASGTGNNIKIVDCSSISIQNDYAAYISQGHETNPPSGLSSLTAGTWSVEQPH